MLQIAHSVFKRWRPQFRTDELFSEIKYVLDIFCQPYLTLFQVLSFRKLRINSGSKWML